MIWRRRPLLLRFLLGVVLPTALLSLLAAVQLTRSLPKEQGEIEIYGLQYPVQVVRDDAGVPHIYARSDHDAFVALGYLHAQDRLWQMEMQRRMAAGRLSEVLGAKALRIDQLMRTLGLARAAKATIAHLNSNAVASLEAYAAGVNAWLAERHVLPIEFVLLGFEPEPWRIQDSLAQVKLMAFNLGANFRDEIEFDMLVRQLGPRRASELYTGEIHAESEIQSASFIEPRLGHALIELSNELAQRHGLGSRGAGSNAWVVSGAHTESKLPLLANDPHLALQLPTQWYLAEIHGDALHVTGATLPGLPCVIFGHNNHIAWGGTAMEADVQDLYLERLNPRDDLQYEYAGRWETMRVVEERIVVRPDFPSALRDPIPPLMLHVRSTRHGPLLSDVLETSEFPLALQWTALQPDDKSYQSFLALNYADSWRAFNDALTEHVAPALNFVYADREGNIGLVAAGRIPLRQSGDGRLPVPGWSEQYEWRGAIPFALLPHEFNPASGVIITANNQNHADDYPYLISSSWAPPYRARRIAEAIQERISSNSRLTPAHFIELQGDVLNLQARELIPFLLSLEPTDSRQQAALVKLAQWDGSSTTDSTAASIYQTWLRHFYEATVKDDLRGDLSTVKRGDALQSLLENTNPLFMKHLAAGRIPWWCDNSATAQSETCRTLGLTALDTALDELKRLRGAEISEWRWGELHRAKVAHITFADAPLLDLFFNRSIGSGGDDYTINVAPAEFSKSKGYQQFFGASYRQVIDLADWSRSRFITNAGQSGNIFSRHYDDFIARHQSNEMLSMRFNIGSALGKRLTLHPRPHVLTQARF